MTEWEESTAKGGIAAPASGQPWTGMPASGGPGSGRGRRAGLVIALVIVLVALGAGGYLFVRSRQHKRAGGNQVAAVRRAYLTWWNARVQEYLTLNPALVKPYMTAAGYQQEQTLLSQFGSEPFELVATHNLQIVVYSDGRDASVDDVWLSNSTYLDTTTHRPTGEPSGLYAEDSTSLKKLGGRWLVDDVVRFGASQAVSGQELSYVAANGGVPPSQPILREIEAVFARYEEISSQAYLTLNSSLLPQVEGGAALQADQSYLDSQKARDEPIRFHDENNYRVALQSVSQAWIYNTFLDESVPLNGRTGKAIKAVVPTVLRIRYQLIKGPSGWTIIADTNN